MVFSISLVHNGGKRKRKKNKNTLLQEKQNQVKFLIHYTASLYTVLFKYFVCLFCLSNIQLFIFKIAPGHLQDEKFLFESNKQFLQT